jgi:peptidoglycan/LPS O-acetylase OafA/YrhL
MNYRKEIDGLRAIAVLSVILSHARFSWIRGGFVGVDVFFVISGYLITTVILSELEAGIFTIKEFYERRARRILPALFFVLLCCLPLSYLWLLPDQMKGFAKSLLSGIFFIANYYFRSTTGYFAPAAEEQPLLHLWSLAVEEQYYVFFPLLAILLWRKKDWHLKVATLVWRHKSWGFITVILLIALVSFRYAERKLGSDTLFYDTRGRVWEFLLGSLTAIYLLRRRWKMPERLVAECSSALGLLLILGACFGFREEMPFPGHWALLPTFGAVLVILFSSPATLTGRLLSTPVLVGIGLISYSAYLWHWPLFAFARSTCLNPPGTWLLSGLAVLSLVLAYFSWRYVECPFRDRQWIDRKSVLRFSVTGTILLAVLGGGGINGLSFRFNTEDMDLFVSNEERAQYVVKHYNELGEYLTFNANTKQRILLMGDSYSQDLFNMIEENRLFPNAEIRVAYIPAKCQIYIWRGDALDFVNEKNRDLCEKWTYKSDFYPSLAPLIQKADIIILAASWAEWAVQRLPETIENLKIPPATRLVILGRKNFGKVNRKSYLGLSLEEKTKLRNRVSDQHLKVNEWMRENLKEKGDFVDLHALVCGESSKTCPLFSRDGKLLSYDGGHLTREGAVYIGSLLKQHPVFESLSLQVLDRRAVLDQK